MAELRLGKYRLLQRLGRGGMAEVYLAEATGPAGFQKTVALKRILPHLADDPEFVHLFLNEARIAARLSHPAIVQIFDLGEADGSYFIAMEYVDGPSLRALCQRAAAARSPLPVAHVARIVADACEGMAFAHEHLEDGRVVGLVHRDISPDNLLLSRAGTVKVGDFGIARASNRRQTQEGLVRGKLWYMPPEQLCDEALDRRVDVYALGVVLYELLCGLLPFDATSETRVIRAILEEPPVPLPQRRPDCPEELWAIVERALAKDRAERYPDCRVLERDLERFLLGRSEIVGAHDVAQLISGLFPDADGPMTAKVAGRPLRPTLPAKQASTLPCPACGGRMKLAHAHGVVVDGCPSCGGLWLDDGEVQQLANRHEGLAAVAQHFTPQGEWDCSARERTCPRCRTPLSPFEFASLRGIQLDRCDICRGLWLDHGEAARIQERLGGA